MRYGQGGCISKCDSESKSNILSTLLKLSQQTWAQIKSSPRNKLGFEKMPQEEFRIAMSSTVTPEVKMIVFRYSDKGRIAGYRIHDILHVVLVGEELYKH